VFSAFFSRRAVPDTPRERGGFFETAHRMMPSPNHERLGPSACAYEATSGFAARYGPSLRSRRLAAVGIPVPLLLDVSRHHAGNLATRMLDPSEVGSFHPTKNAPLRGAPRFITSRGGWFEGRLVARYRGGPGSPSTSAGALTPPVCRARLGCDVLTRGRCNSKQGISRRHGGASKPVRWHPAADGRSANGSPANGEVLRSAAPSWADLALHPPRRASEKGGRRPGKTAGAKLARWREDARSRRTIQGNR